MYVFVVGTMGRRNNRLSEQWAVGIMGCRNNGSSELWAVGIMTRNRFVCTGIYAVSSGDIKRRIRVAYDVAFNA